MSTSRKTCSRPTSLAARKDPVISQESETNRSLAAGSAVTNSKQSIAGNKLTSPQLPGVLQASVSGGRLLTLKEAAARLAISLPTIRSWVWQRKIEIVKIGRCVRIREQVISELIFKGTIPPRPGV